MHDDMQESMQAIAHDPRLRAEVAAHPYPLLFATVSGAHLYGFASADSDFDLRGAHVTPTELLAGLDTVPETVSLEHVRDGAEVDLVTHEARKFFRLLLRDNGYVLEQLYSPLVVHATPAHEELRAAARGCLTSACARHYLGFAANQWLLFEKERPRRVKPLLYTFRVLLTGIHLMRAGEIDANLERCASLTGERLPFLGDLLARKRGGAEGETLEGGIDVYEREYLRLRERLTSEAERSALPAKATAGDHLKDLLRRIRIASPAAAHAATPNAR